VAIEIGTRIGTHRVTALIGAGGMGEVYRATDERLGRDVAIKVLNQLADADWRERLEREARLLASINHAHIGAIYGVEDVDGAPALILELIEGQTLAAVLRDGALPPGRAIAFARQIAQALEAAHARGIIHRDLKPSNVIVTPAQQIKVLDFGLAKSITPSPHELATKTASLTREGTVMGTAAYMSPEQARGMKVDAQADIWAFGAVLFEMITGTRVFDGETSSDVIAAILKTDPDWSRIPPGTPANVVRVMRRCLDKDPSRRLHAIADARIDLEDPSPPPEREQRPAQHTWVYLAVAGALALVVAAAGYAASIAWRRPAAAPAIARFAIAGGADLVDSSGVAISHDGTAVAYVTLADGVRQIAVRQVDRIDPRLIAGTDGAAQPFFSPDGRWIGFFSGGKLRKVPVAGGTSEVLADAPSPRGGAWGPDDTIVFAPAPAGVLMRVSAAGGTAQPLTKLGDREASHRYPDFLPGGKAIVYAAGPSGTVVLWSEASIIVESLVETGKRFVVAQRGTTPRVLPSGDIAYVQLTQLQVAPFAPDRLAATGSPVALDEHVLRSATGFAQYGIAGNGTMVSVPSSYVPTGRLALVDRNGVATLLDIRVPFQSEARISPDGSKIAYTAASPDAEVWVYDIAQRTARQLTTGGGNVWPIWSPDGRRIAYGSFRYGSLAAFVRDASGGPERELNRRGGPAQWLPDGSGIAMQFVEEARAIWVLDEGASDARPLSAVQPRDTSANFSKNGKFVAAVSTDSGRGEVVVYPYPGPGDRIQISNGGGGEPVWRRDGREIFYRRGLEMMSVEVISESPLRFGTPKTLFNGSSFSSGGNRANYDVMPDGQHFLMVALDEPRPAMRLTATLNWFDSIRGKLPR
jgi:Tol biopolymer transport system component